MEGKSMLNVDSTPSPGLEPKTEHKMKKGTKVSQSIHVSAA